MYHSSSSVSTDPPLFNLSLAPPSFGDDDDGYLNDEAPEMPPDSPPSPAPSTSSSSAESSSASPSPSPPPVESLRRSLRTTRGVPPVRYLDYMALSVDPIFAPTRYSQAKGNPDWDNSMTEEIYALHANHTWDMVPRPPLSVPVIGSRWVYTIKVRPDGSIERFKSRVVAQGFCQEYGIDFEETFAPVAKMVTVRALLTVASIRGWPLFQLDVKNAFLHGELKETVYMEPPPGYTFGEPGQVCLLRRSLYGLKQAPRAWFDKFHSTILALGFEQSLNDPSMFTRSSSRGLVVLLLYVDDMIVTGDDALGIAELTKGLHASFSLKELGYVSYFLGLEVKRSSAGILLCQRKYIDDLLASSRFGECSAVSTPMELGLKLGSESGDLQQQLINS
ncbi:unnamed protein product [Linum trigynum]|uniref:Reverse transcriptase Ty1/copia-type domain-containing protein n=1 Tax=Linum trigynum TaxID=586398 RepID=A0AAV2FSQ6_9ROSI